MCQVSLNFNFLLCSTLSLRAVLHIVNHSDELFLNFTYHCQMKRYTKFYLNKMIQSVI